MKKIKILLTVVAVCLGLVGLTSTGSQVQAASHGDKYGRVKLFTMPKNMRGTWYSYTGKGKYAKTKITKHTVDGNKVYVQSKWWRDHKAGKSMDAIFNNIGKFQKMKIMRGYNTKLYGRKFVYVDDWLRLMGFGSYYRIFNKKVAGKKQKMLFISMDSEAGYFGNWYSKKKSVASHFKKSLYTNPYANKSKANAKTMGYAVRAAESVASQL